MTPELTSAILRHEIPYESLTVEEREAAHLLVLERALGISLRPSDQIADCLAGLQRLGWAIPHD